jgi:uncharacterized membrane protein YhaH (DUF805 family)
VSGSPEGEAVRAGFDYGATIFLVALQVMLSIYAVGYVFLRSFDVSCVGIECDYRLAGLAVQLVFWTALVLVPVTLIWISARRHSDEDAPTWFVPTTAIAVLGVTVLVCAALQAAAVDKPLFG